MDDSGNVDAAASNDPNCRYGSVSAVIMEQDYVDDTFNGSFAALVEKHFGTNPDGSPLNLHRRRLVAPPDHGPFSVLKDNIKRAEWDRDVLRMFDIAKYTVITAGVDKVEWYWRYPSWNGDFYEVLVRGILERCFYYLRNRGVAEVNIETKNPGRDRGLKDNYRRAFDTGYEHISADRISKVFSSREINIVQKKECKPGAQLVDLVAGPAMQHIRHRNTGRHQPKGKFVTALCDILQQKKFYREGSNGPNGYGCVWRPRPMRKN